MQRPSFFRAPPSFYAAGPWPSFPAALIMGVLALCLLAVFPKDQSWGTIATVAAVVLYTGFGGYLPRWWPVSGPWAKLLASLAFWGAALGAFIWFRMKVVALS